jgi:hypothetical protein
MYVVYVCSTSTINTGSKYARVVVIPIVLPYYTVDSITPIQYIYVDVESVGLFGGEGVGIAGP